MGLEEMKCAKCGHNETKVIESRLNLEGISVRRRRSCLECNYRFTTYEKEEEWEFQVRKKDGRFEPYCRDKALKVLHAACSKRPIGVDAIESLLDGVICEVQGLGERVVDSRTLGDLVMAQLRELDQVAYVRFASIYKEFRDSEQFIAELQNLISGPKTPDKS
jgi:transcriptional repressor NrdR